MGKRKYMSDNADGLEDTTSVKSEDGLPIKDEQDESTSHSTDTESVSSDLGTESSDDLEYDESTESLPRCPAYDKDFDQLSTDLGNIASSIVSIIDGSQCDNGRSQNCRRKALALTSPPPAKKDKVALLGAAGAGKSSLINSLLGIPGLAKAMAPGQSCTYVCTEYCHMLPEQETDFAAIVEYYDSNGFRTILTKLLDDYKIYYLEPKEDLEEDSERELEKRANSAVEVFVSLFRDHEEAESLEIAKDFLKRSYDECEIGPLETFVAWCEQLLQERGLGEANCTETFHASSKDELLLELDPLALSVGLSERPALWPLVRRVRIGVKPALILEYVTLVDMPGISDINTVRIEATMQQLRECDAIWIVSKIDRVVTDSEVDSIIRRYGKVYDAILVICTAIDDNIDPALAEHLKSKSQDLGEYGELHMKALDLGKKVRELKKKISTQQKTILRSRTSTDPRGVKRSAKARVKAQNILDEITPELQQAEAELSDVEAREFVATVNARNSYVHQRLRNGKRGHLPTDKLLEIFCVSNTHYASCKGARSITGPRLDVKDTGIPALRLYVKYRAAPARLQAIQYYIDYQFSAFMEGIELWMAKELDKKKWESLLEEIKKCSSNLSAITSAYVNALKAAVRLGISNPLRGMNDQLIQHACEELRKISGWGWATIRAFINRDGNYGTPIAPKQSWNENFMKPVIYYIDNEGAWDTFIVRQEDYCKEMETKCLEILDAIQSKVENHPAGSRIPGDIMQRMILTHQKGIKHVCHDFQENATKALRHIHVDLVQGTPTGFFSRAMADTYKSCRSHIGRGYKARVEAVLSDHLTISKVHSPFFLLTDNLFAAVDRDATVGTETLAKSVQDSLDDIYNQCKSMINFTKRGRAEKELVAEIHREFEGRSGFKVKFEDIKADLARIKRRYD